MEKIVIKQYAKQYSLTLTEDEYRCLKWAIQTAQQGSHLINDKDRKTLIEMEKVLNA